MGSVNSQPNQNMGRKSSAALAERRGETKYRGGVLASELRVFGMRLGTVSFKGPKPSTVTRHSPGSKR
jgi:hypothetical protein